MIQVYSITMIVGNFSWCKKDNIKLKLENWGKIGKIGDSGNWGRNCEIGANCKLVTATILSLLTFL